MTIRIKRQNMKIFQSDRRLGNTDIETSKQDMSNKK